jgi:hypothetical protein
LCIAFLTNFDEEIPIAMIKVDSTRYPNTWKVNKIHKIITYNACATESGKKLRNNHVVYGGRRRAGVGRVGRLQVVDNIASEKRQVLRESEIDRILK